MFNLYNLLALTEVKGYAMLQFSYLILRLSNRGNYTLESDLANKNFDMQVTNINGINHRYLIEVDCSLDQFKLVKLKDKKHTINAPVFS